jgi:hypothetical protein
VRRGCWRGVQFDELAAGTGQIFRPPVEIFYAASSRSARAFFRNLP